MLPMPPLHFVVFIAVSLLLFVAVLRLSLRHRARQPSARVVALLAFVVVVVGMVFAKFGANLGLPWAIYYGVPAFMAFALTPLVLRMGVREALVFVLLTALTSPLIHVVFSVFVGWHEYLPFWPVPEWQAI